MALTPYPYEGLPGSEHAYHSVADVKRQDHVTLQELLDRGEEVDGVLFRLLGYPGGKVRRALPFREEGRGWMILGLRADIALPTASKSSRLTIAGQASSILTGAFGS